MANTIEVPHLGGPEQSGSLRSLAAGDSQTTASTLWPTLPQTTTVLEPLGSAGDPQVTGGRVWSRWGAATGGAHDLVNQGQTFRAAIALLPVLALGILVGWKFVAILATLAITLLYLLSGIHKITLLRRALRYQDADRVVAPPPLPDDKLPVYTVLVPLQREGPMFPHLVARLDALDYPRDRLEVLLLIEAADSETFAAVSALGPGGLPKYMRVVVVPAGEPKTKPRALNVGLNLARGRYIVVFDAEDHPDSDQLRKAAAAFAVLPKDVICLQAQLNFYNARQSWLSRLFATDYILWYALVLPGLSRSSAFIPLGGTSNHFRIVPLRRMGGWDPWNVTEDADLGVRIGRGGLRVRMLDSTTWEEAVPKVRPWIRQRSRWIKGYMQTHMVHMRHPKQSRRELGLGGLLDLQLLLGGTAFALLANPIMWFLTLVYIFASFQGTAGAPAAEFIRSIYPAPIFYLAITCQIAGNFFFLYTIIVSCLAYGWDDLVPWALLAPFYWLLMSVAAWRAVFSLVRNPSHWAKTEHGVSLQRSPTTSDDSWRAPDRGRRQVPATA